MTTTRLSKPRASAFASALDLDLDAAGVCHACLSFVSFAMDAGDVAEIERQLRHMTKDLWADGLDEPALAAARDARARGVRDAERALADLEERGGRSVIAREIVRRLAAELSRRARAMRQARALSRERLRSAPPELN